MRHSHPWLRGLAAAACLSVMWGCGPGADVEQAIVGSRDRGVEVVVEAELRQLRTALMAVHAESGQWPRSLDVLVEQRMLPSVPKDPFGQAYFYEPPAGRGQPGRLYSAGKDEQPGTRDDMVLEISGF